MLGLLVLSLNCTFAFVDAGTLGKWEQLLLLVSFLALTSVPSLLDRAGFSAGSTQCECDIH